MPEVVEYYRGFALSIECTPDGWRVRVAALRATIPIPHHLRQVARPEKEDAIREAKGMVDYLIGPCFS